MLDFGYVVLGTVRTHIIRATNTGFFPVSFSADRISLAGTGFNVELDRVRHLPGFPDHETVDFRVSFDPLGSNLGLGDVEALIPVNVSTATFWPFVIMCHGIEWNGHRSWSICNICIYQMLKF